MYVLRVPTWSMNSPLISGYTSLAANAPTSAPQKGLTNLWAHPTTPCYTQHYEHMADNRLGVNWRSSSCFLGGWLHPASG